MDTEPRQRTDALHELLEPVVSEAGLFLEAVEVTRAGRYSTVRVVVDLLDGPGGLDLDALTLVTRAVSQAMDEADPLAGQYTLEVTSPGAERELLTPRHLRRAVGRHVELELGDGPSERTVHGVLESAQPLTVLTDSGAQEIDPDSLRRARTVVVM